MGGIVADLQRSSVHDGPGLRTTVFLKGCQLDCPWCHNPETISPQPEELYYPEKCIGCNQCANGCFSAARVLCGREMSVEDVLAEVALDAPYYGKDGGVTLSGGEPLCQREFALELLRACRERGVHTAMETNLCFPPVYTRSVLAELDLLMADLKFWDPQAHRRWTGQTNGFVKENLWQASGMGLPIILRTPVIPGVNDTTQEISAIARFAAGLETLVYYELLAYHPLGLSKAAALGRETQRFEKPAPAHMQALGEAAAAEGVPVRINARPLE